MVREIKKYRRDLVSAKEECLNSLAEIRHLTRTFWKNGYFTEDEHIGKQIKLLARIQEIQEQIKELKTFDYCVPSVPKAPKVLT